MPTDFDVSALSIFQKAKPGELALAGSEKTCSVFSLAGFVTRPQAEHQIGATEVDGTLPARPGLVKSPARPPGFNVPSSKFHVRNVARYGF
jgi:hypothetical protein